MVRQVAAACLALWVALGSLTVISTGATPARPLFVPVLTYHHVTWFRKSDDAIELGLTVQPPQFLSEMAYLRTHGYHTVSAAAVVAALRTGRRLPNRPVVLTFDDGYRDMWTQVYPVLLRDHLTATFFIVPGLLGGPRYLTWSQVETMSAHGMDIEAHTMTHPDLTLVPARQRDGELSSSRRVLESRLHRSIRIMAYPYGDYNPAVLAAVARAGYWAAFTTRQGWTLSSAELLTLPRVYVDNDDSPAIFAGRLVEDPSVLAADPT